MKKISLLLIIVLSLFACKNEPKGFTLYGEITNLNNDTIMVFATLDDTCRVDTIYAQGGKFDYSLSVDTTTQLTLRFNGNEIYTLYADKGEQSKLTGDATFIPLLKVSGSPLNDELNAFIQGVAKDSLPLQRKQAEQFIRTHPFSPVSIHLLDRYFVQTETPDLHLLKELIATMSGELQDNSYVEQLSEFINDQLNLEIGKQLPYFNLENQKGDRITRTTFKDKYLLVDFWASWCTPCKAEHKKLRNVYTARKKKKFDILGVSFDVDKKRWKEAIRKDSLSWQQVCDYTGWGSSLATKFGVSKIPSNLLVSPEGTIIAKNLTDKELTDKLKDLLK